jgi:hypothetical protein
LQVICQAEVSAPIRAVTLPAGQERAAALEVERLRQPVAIGKITGLVGVGESLDQG